MKKIILILLLLLLTLSNVYADNVSTGKINTGNEFQKIEVFYTISPQFSGIEQFYKKDLSSNDISNIKKIYDDFNIKSKEMFFASSCDILKSYTQLLKDFYQSVDKYIDITEYDRFVSYMVSNSTIKTDGICYTKPHIEFEKAYKISDVKILSDNKLALLKTKLEKYDYNKLNLLKKKVDLLKIKFMKDSSKNRRTIIILTQLEELIQDILDNKYVNDLIN